MSEKKCSCGTSAEVAALRAEVAKLSQLGVTKTRKGITLPEGSWVVLPDGTAAQVGPDGVSYREESVHNVNDRGVEKAVGRALSGASNVPQTGKWKHFGNPHPALRGGRS